MMSKQLAIFINVSVEAPAQRKLFDLGALDDVADLMMACKASDAQQKEVLQRVFNFLSKVLRLPEAAAQCAR
jgi:hypothetical protein